MSHGKLQRSGQLFSYPVRHSELLFRGELRSFIFVARPIYTCVARPIYICCAVYYSSPTALVVAIDGNFCQEYL